jgi:catechol 2,3-dioxygenase-like lactoylglutathione lyase family enzyme
MIDHIDHIVLTTRDQPGCIRFYTEVLGMKLVTFRTPTEERLALAFGEQKINLMNGAANTSRTRTCRCRGRSISASSPPCRWTR